MSRQVSLIEATEDNFLFRAKDTFLLCRLLGIKRYDQKPLVKYIPHDRLKLRGTESTNYDRLAFFGQLNSSSVFAVIANKTCESAKLFGHPALSIGSVCKVIEPIFNGVYLGNDRGTPILEVRRQIEPQSVYVSDLEDVPIDENPESAALFHFQISGKIWLKFFEFPHSLVDNVQDAKSASCCRKCLPHVVVEGCAIGKTSIRDVRVQNLKVHQAGP